MAEVSIRFLLLRLRQGEPLDLRERSQWLHRSCRTVLRRCGMHAQFRGTRPAQGLMCSNHLSYLDIVVYAATMPCVFVSKREVGQWPVIGWLARCGGTLFLDRHSRASADEVAERIAATLRQDIPVLLFPEGTSTDGSSVLRFHSTLIEPGLRLPTQITAAAIAYSAQGRQERDLCWYGEQAFIPHLLRTLSRAGIAAEVEFFPDRILATDRKSAALELHSRVEAMRQRMRREACR